MAAIIFWISLAGVAYVYIGYPLLLMAWRRLARSSVQKRACEPAVSLVIAMQNEAGNVLPKLKNCRELDYPPDKLQVIVSLDAPTDSTIELLREFASPGVEIVYSPVRHGKAAAVNRGCCRGYRRDRGIRRCRATAGAERCARAGRKFRG